MPEKGALFESSGVFLPVDGFPIDLFWLIAPSHPTVNPTARSTRLHKPSFCLVARGPPFRAGQRLS